MEKITVATIREMKDLGERATMVAAYDYLMGRMADESGIDIILVGDSLANVVLGYDDTLSVTMDEMIHHTKAVSRGVKRALVVGDLPFMSYQASVEDAIKNAGRFLKEGHAEAVKVEGGCSMIEKIEAIIQSGIPVMGHLGLTPQWYHQFGGFKVRGKTESTARMILKDAQRLERVGVFSIVLECIPWQLAKLITEKVSVPTIGIGAGPYCDGQVLVLHDLLGMTPKTPKFVKRYAKLDETIVRALSEFRRDVKSNRFPALEHSYDMPREEMRKLLKEFRRRR
ncbi:MAG: 3-methyl-2-oxobutanoate hydroxymethyltransferase [Hadesarchaea archaeon]|nr:MAG: 3-methyl-2-oxobutanoate hydroxymethyltransferase [Hadesarchaea archaeon]HDI12988.1 3-methyl-2-oxobutanoate hydroxymethyltransferase [Hadesarchaea archaeon]